MPIRDEWRFLADRGILPYSMFPDEAPLPSEPAISDRPVPTVEPESPHAGPSTPRVDWQPLAPNLYTRLDPTGLQHFRTEQGTASGMPGKTPEQLTAAKAGTYSARTSALTDRNVAEAILRMKRQRDLEDMEANIQSLSRSYWGGADFARIGRIAELQQTLAGLRQTSKPQDYEEYTDAEGARWRVDRRTGERMQVGPPLKTAQPHTDTYMASVASGAVKDPHISPEKAQASLDYRARARGKETEERISGKIRAEAKLLDLVTFVAAGRAGANVRGRFEANLDIPITASEATLYRIPANTTRRQLLELNPKPITEADIDAGTQFEAAKAMLEEYRDVATRLLTATDAAGSLGQRVTLAYGAYVRTNEDAVRLRALQATVPLLVRALGEKGTLATADVTRALNAVPDFADTQQSAQAKIRQLESFMATVEGRIKMLRPGLERQQTDRTEQIKGSSSSIESYWRWPNLPEGKTAKWTDGKVYRKVNGKAVEVR